MEGHIIMLDTPLASLSVEFAGFPDVLTRSNSDTSSLTDENCKDVLPRSDNCRAWTDEKHNLYLKQLEVSFVTQLHQSKGIVGKCYELNERNIYVTRKRPVDTHNFSGQFTVLRNGRWQNIKSERVELLSHTSADSCCHPKSECHPKSTDKDEFLNLSGAHKLRKRAICHEFATSSRKCSTSNLYLGNSFDITKEGTGQNFVDDKNQSKSNMDSQAKRLKRASVNTPNLDQIVPQQPSDNKTNSSLKELPLPL